LDDLAVTGKQVAGKKITDSGNSRTSGPDAFPVNLTGGAE
jgi:hypothetical protein